MRESDERPWGRYEVLEEQPGFKVKVLEVKPAPPQPAAPCAARGALVVVKGVADVVCGAEELQLRQASSSYPLETNHRLGNSGDVHSKLLKCSWQLSR